MDFRITRKEISSAFRTSFPIMVTFIVLGIGFGLLMQKHGFGPLWSLASGIIIFSGTVQFVSIALMSTGSVLMAGLTALMVSARHIFFSISMIGRYSREGARKWYLYYALCDETYAMLSRDDTPEGVNLSGYRLLVTLFDQLSWLVGCVLGGCAGTLLHFNSTGIDFAMVALFTTVFLQQWIDTKNHVPAVTGLLATLVCRLIFGRDFFLIPAMIIIVVTMTVMRRRIEKGDAGEEADQARRDADQDRPAGQDRTEADQTDIETGGEDRA